MPQSSQNLLRATSSFDLRNRPETSGVWGVAGMLGRGITLG